MSGAVSGVFKNLEKFSSHKCVKNVSDDNGKCYGIHGIEYRLIL